jgi:hypothetical protein
MLPRFSILSPPFFALGFFGPQTKICTRGVPPLKVGNQIMYKQSGIEGGGAQWWSFFSAVSEKSENWNDPRPTVRESKCYKKSLNEWKMRRSLISTVWPENWNGFWHSSCMCRCPGVRGSPVMFYQQNPVQFQISTPSPDLRRDPSWPNRQRVARRNCFSVF